MKESNGSPDPYGLGRDATETARLNEQHEFMTACLSFLIHPSIPTDSPTLRVADVATGSGIWLTDFATKYPHARCDGFDVSDAQFPPVKDLSNLFGDRVQFHVHDASSREGVPEDFRGKFDIVAVRLAVINFVGEEWDRAVGNVVSMLKPGGFVQWVDWDPFTAHVVQIAPLARKTAIQTMLSGFRIFLRTRDTPGTARISGLLTGNGVEIVESGLYPADKDEEWRYAFSKTLIIGVPGIIKKMIREGKGEDWTEAKVDETVELYQEELREGKAFIRCEFWCHVGQKAER